MPCGRQTAEHFSCERSNASRHLGKTHRQSPLRYSFPRQGQSICPDQELSYTGAGQHQRGSKFLPDLGTISGRSSGSSRVYRMLILGFRHPEISLFYVVGLFLITNHLNHAEEPYMNAPPLTLICWPVTKSPSATRKSTALEISSARAKRRSGILLLIFVCTASGTVSIMSVAV